MLSRMDPCVFIPSSLSQGQMVFVILIVSQVRPSSALAEAGEIDRPSTGRTSLVRGCLNNPSRLV
jgi:hypothetical protein